MWHKEDNSNRASYQEATTSITWRKSGATEVSQLINDKNGTFPVKVKTLFYSDIDLIHNLDLLYSGLTDKKSDSLLNGQSQLKLCNCEPSLRRIQDLPGRGTNPKGQNLPKTKRVDQDTLDTPPFGSAKVSNLFNHSA